MKKFLAWVILILFAVATLGIFPFIFFVAISAYAMCWAVNEITK